LLEQKEVKPFGVNWKRERQMKLHGVEIRLDRTKDGIEYEEENWSIVPGTHKITHCLSHITFEIVLDEGAEKKEVVSLFDFSACPLHICEGHKLPNRDELTRIGQEAIFVFLKAIGSYVPTRPDEERPGGEPDLSVN
jgi:hypothetical protein